MAKRRRAARAAVEDAHERVVAEGYGFGTAPVFLASISTILGAVLFLRFGYAVGHAGLLGALTIVIIGHLVTVPTALAIAEIATNRRVEGGGEYFIISRSFGTTIGASIGLSLYLSQAISVAFYMIAFAEAFQPLAPLFTAYTGVAFDPRFVSLPATLVLLALVLTRGANLGVGVLWVVSAILGVSLTMFFLGGPVEGAAERSVEVIDRVSAHDPFMVVFAIVFPAFTGMTAGVGLSGDLANPRRSIPLGILSATALGLIIYLFVVAKLAWSAPPDVLATDQLVMSRIALWGPIIPIGLACATISSAIGSVLVAPRTLQALAADRVTPLARVNHFLARGSGGNREPRNATLVTSAIAIGTVLAGDVDFVARIISMFFMVTYGALCAIGFLEHLAARPSYRPSFRSKWYVSLVGAVMCLFLMFQMDPLYAAAALLVMAGIYRIVAGSHRQEADLAALFQAVMGQATRYSTIRLQRATSRASRAEWRPSIVMVSSRTFLRSSPQQFLAWLAHRYGFGTYLHHVVGVLNDETYKEARRAQIRLIQAMRTRNATLFVDTMISPSERTALAQSLQMPGVGGGDNNTVLLDFSTEDDPAGAARAAEGAGLAAAARMNTFVLRHGSRFFGTRRTIHIWLTWHDARNANLMILLAYILLGHEDWHQAEVRIFAAYPRAEVDERRAALSEMITTGRLPISPKNLRVIGTDGHEDFERIVEVRSSGADLVIFGFTRERLHDRGAELFERYESIADVLFVAAREEIAID